MFAKNRGSGTTQTPALAPILRNGHCVVVDMSITDKSTNGCLMPGVAPYATESQDLRSERKYLDGVAQC